MSELIPSIPLITGILLGLAIAVGAGYFVYGAVLYLNASADLVLRQRGRTAMRYAFAAFALALVAFGATDLLVDTGALPPASIDVQPLHLGR
ncbi:MAG: hypothetical protein OXH13_08360 [Chloroflexi bacterium]|nr:hypothetical protein [Chloroflexota bacterium]MXX30790.1 hypothetical protein [Chloroflexota bacterium]MYD15991.1 hypothetical protein [Chloroflexota bacterium]MYF22831.1 hypothetical protein [Chloroflexota bacterium]